jgi:hypothetical protein
MRWKSKVLNSSMQSLGPCKRPRLNAYFWRELWMMSYNIFTSSNHTTIFLFDHIRLKNSVFLQQCYRSAISLQVRRYAYATTHKTTFLRY